MNEHPALERVGYRPIFAVVQTPSADSSLKAAQAAIAGGIKLLLVALNAPGAHRVISDLRRDHGDAILVGAASVLSMDTADRAAKAGAQMLASPHTNTKMIEFCTSRGILGIAGAATPTEIASAWALGAPIVQVYPASSFGGAGYIRAMKEMFDDVRLMPMGGIGPENMVMHFRSGSYAIGIGRGLFPPGDIQTGNYTAIAERARSLVRAFEQRA